jgi:hypothetical protein
MAQSPLWATWGWLATPKASFGGGRTTPMTLGSGLASSNDQNGGGQNHPHLA